VTWAQHNGSWLDLSLVFDPSQPDFPICYQVQISFYTKTPKLEDVLGSSAIKGTKHELFNCQCQLDKLQIHCWQEAEVILVHNTLHFMAAQVRTTSHTVVGI
jgi:hypothetical protein